VLFDLLMRGAGIGVLLLLLARLLYRRGLRFPEISFAALIVSVVIYVLLPAPMPLTGNVRIWGFAAYLPVPGIAFAVGFASIGPFNRAFKAFQGVSPSRYRADDATQAGQIKNSA